MTSSRVSGSAPISLVIPTINRADALRRCLLAILDGTRLPDEVIVVDQSDPGRCTLDRDLLDRFAGRGVIVRHLPVRFRGVSRARNTGIRLSAGDLIAFTDDDCVPAPGWLAALESALLDAAAPAHGASGRVLPLPSEESGLVPVSSRIGEQPDRFCGRHALQAGRTPWEAGTGGNLLLRRGALRAAGGFDETLGPGAPGRAAEDVELLYRLLAADCVLAYAPAAVVYHEMKPRRDRVRSRWPYGYGMGAALADHVRRRDRRALALYARYLADGALKIAGAARRGRWWEATETALALAGSLTAFGTRLACTVAR